MVTMNIMRRMNDNRLRDWITLYISVDWGFLHKHNFVHFVLCCRTVISF